MRKMLQKHAKTIFESGSMKKNLYGVHVFFCKHPRVDVLLKTKAKY